MKICPAEQDFFISKFFLVQRRPAKCSSFQWCIDTITLPCSHLGMSSLCIFKCHKFLQDYKSPLFLLTDSKHRTSLFYFVDFKMGFIIRKEWKLNIH